MPVHRIVVRLIMAHLQNGVLYSCLKECRRCIRTDLERFPGCTVKSKQQQQKQTSKKTEKKTPKEQKSIYSLLLFI